MEVCCIELSVMKLDSDSATSYNTVDRVDMRLLYFRPNLFKYSYLSSHFAPLYRKFR